MGDHRSGPKYFVTSSNHAWVSQETGWPLEVIAEEYEKAKRDDVVCVMTRMPGGLTADKLSELGPMHMVRQFMTVFGQQIRLEPTAAISNGELRLRIGLIHEEWVKELKPAMLEGDLVEIADGLADLVYVIYGAALTYGIDLDKVLAEVHRSNMSKLQPDGSVLKDEFGKVMKGPDYFKPDIAGVLEDQKAPWQGDLRG